MLLWSQQEVWLDWGVGPYWEGDSPETTLIGDISLLSEVERFTHHSGATHV